MESTTTENLKIVQPKATGENALACARIASTNWSVKTLGNTYDFTASVPNRFSNNGSTLVLKVLAIDPTTSSNTIYAK